ncbi:zinc-binding dehydrogenase [Candidatus Poribacteria bacterium]
MNKTMKALVKFAPGPGNLELRDIPVPEIGDDDILMKVSYGGICGSDLHIETGIHPCDPPVAIGHEFSGVVAEVGKNVTRFRDGDLVAFWKGWSPYPGVGANGGFAEYLRAPADCMWKTPEDISQEEATQFETIMTPMALVRDVARLRSGERVVVSGPGHIGLLTTNVARIDGASHITVIGAAGDEALRLPKALEVGADEAIQFGEEALEKLKDNPPSVWFEASGAAAPIEAAVECVARGGRVVLSGLGDGPWNVNMRRVAYRSLKILGKWGGNQAYLEESVELMLSGKLKMATTITDVIPLTKWQDAFEKARRCEGVKILLDPSQ